MESDRPMRHEEYVALAEENRRLTQENCRLQAEAATQTERAPRPVRVPGAWRKWWVDYWVPVVLLALLVDVVGVGTCLLVHDVRDSREQTAAVSCYAVGQRRGASSWEPWHVYEIRDSRTKISWEKEQPREYDTHADAEAVLRKWGGKVCGFDLRDARVSERTR